MGAHFKPSNFDVLKRMNTAETPKAQLVAGACWAPVIWDDDPVCKFAAGIWLCREMWLSGLFRL
jgi:hypothetical protein